MMNCPKCKTVTLVQAAVRQRNDVLIDYCPACKGFWLDRDELEKITPAAIRDLSVPPDAEPAPYLCPACEDQLVAFDYPQTLVTVDMCRDCKGVWLDDDELKEIEVIRGTLQKQGQAVAYDSVRGVKGTLIDFIQNAIDYLNSC